MDGKGRGKMIAKVQSILKRIIEKVDQIFPSFLQGNGIFFSVLNEKEIFSRSFGSVKENMDSFLLSIINNDHPQVIKIDFQTQLKTGQSINLHIGIYLMDTEEVDQKANEMILLGIKQSILMAIENLNERSNYQSLFEITKKLHSSIEIDQVLKVVLSSMRELYPHYETTIWLSHDYDQKHPIKVLSFQGEQQDPNTQAFILGETIIYELDGKKAISSPMKGNQGIYGVLQLIEGNEQIEIAVEANFISMIAETAGTALENANLYQQSQRLIGQLQLINETSEQLSKTLNLDSNIEFLLNKVMSTFRPENVYFLAYIKGKNQYCLLGGSVHSRQNEMISIDEGSYLKQVHQSQEPLIVSDNSRTEKGLLSSEYEKEHRSIMLVPMLHHQMMVGMIIVSHSQAHHFTYDDFLLLQTLVHHASFAFVNSTLHEEVNRMVITDNLTKLYARNYLDQEIFLSQSRDQCGSFILIDIDNFKGINDAYGHQVGDDILIQVANVMKSSLRESDIAARWGGEELAIYLPNVTIETAYLIAERIRIRVSKETSPSITISSGVSHWRQEDAIKSSKRLFKKADASLYEAKGTGKNRVVLSS